ncbi:MAG: hypothetical protein ABR548_10555 [Actinomycetota bacterium]
MTKSRRASLIPGSAYLAVASALAVLIAVLPRTGNQSPPPTIAEFAPQAANEVRHALAPQSSNTGKGAGACVEGQVCEGGPSATPSPEGQRTIEVPKTQCVIFGSVVLQTEDPQSPSCAPPFREKVHKSLSKGIDDDGTIRVAVPDVPFEKRNEIDLLFAYFNKRFEFYGRKLEPVHFIVGVLNGPPSPATEEEHADDVDQTYHAFASLTYAGQSGAEQYYYDELARKGIISVAHRAGAKTTDAYLRGFGPYRWAVLPGIETMQAHMAEMVCKVLAGRAPEYAGPGVSAAKRTFGLIYGRASDGTKPDLTIFRHYVGQHCGGIATGADVEFEQTSDQAQTASRATNAMLKMIQANVTSVICFCESGDVSGPLMQAASGEQYRPEWIVSTYIDNDVDNSYSRAPTDQSGHVIGVTFRNKWLSRDQMFWFKALQEFAPPGSIEPIDAYPMTARYSSLLLLASGIQLAGPDLTPASFARGLLGATFPNPYDGGAPYYEARVGFDHDAHTMIHDATMFWFSQSDTGHYDTSNVGRVCYVDKGKRYRLGSWPSQAQFYAADCGDTYS